MLQRGLVAPAEVINKMLQKVEDIEENAGLWGVEVRRSRAIGRSSYGG